MDYTCIINEKLTALQQQMITLWTLVCTDSWTMAILVG
jgi:hypothetical protein